MSLLMEALRKAEEAKRKAREKAGAESPEPGERPDPGPEGEGLSLMDNETLEARFPSPASPEDRTDEVSDPVAEHQPSAERERAELDELRDYVSNRMLRARPELANLNNEPESPETEADGLPDTSPGATAEPSGSPMPETPTDSEEADPEASPAVDPDQALQARAEARRQALSQEQDQHSANTVFLAKQAARRRQGQRQRMMVLVGLLVLVPVAGGLFLLWQQMMMPTVVAPPPGMLADNSARAPADRAADNRNEAAPGEDSDTMTAAPVDGGSAATNGPDAGATEPAESTLRITALPDPAARIAAEGTQTQDRAGTRSAPADPQATPAQESGPPLQNSALRVTRRQSSDTVTPELNEAYEFYLDGNMAAAAARYLELLEREPDNRDALLGLATFYQRQGDTAGAQRLYARLLQLNPRDPLARAGLIEAARSADPLRRESDLRQLQEEFPALAPVSFALGNLYASRQRWREAQNAYFDALRKARTAGGGPVSPDYAFNLAISLERIGQPSLALDYYREADSLAAQSSPGFDLNVLRQRLQTLQQALP